VRGLWLSSQGCYVNANGQESELEPAKGLKKRAPMNRAIATERASQDDRTHPSQHLVHQMQPHVNTFNVVPTIPTVNSLVRVQVTIGHNRGRQTRRAHVRSRPRVPSIDRTCRTPQQRTSQVSSKEFPERLIVDRTCQVHPDRTHPASGHPSAHYVSYIILTGRISVASGHILTLCLVMHQG
jgi:hypothetical protein